MHMVVVIHLPIPISFPSISRNQMNEKQQQQKNKNLNDCCHVQDIFFCILRKLIQFIQLVFETVQQQNLDYNSLTAYFRIKGIELYFLSELNSFFEV